MAAEAAHWEKYFYDLNNKVKMQREEIKTRDERVDRHRKKLFETELEMRIMHAV